jgi:hypothetical protein
MGGIMPFNLSEARVREVATTAVEQAAARLQVPAAEIAPEMRTEIEQRVRQSLEVEASRFIGDLIPEVARQAVTPDQRALLGQRVSAQLQTGLGMVNLISEDANYIEIVKKNANMQKIKYDAYVEVGFSLEQAFRLLEVEVMGKASARANR